MQLGKILAAGTMGLLMAGSTLAFAATLADYPQPFITSDGAADFLVVVGATALPEDVVGAIDVATRLGSESFTSYSCPGSSGATTVTGEGAAVATTNTKIYLGDYLKKTGARYTVTAAELPTVLKSGTLEDSELSTTYDYNQYVELSDDFNVQFAQYKPTSGSTLDPALLLIDKTLSNPSQPSTADYVYKEKVVFEKEVNGTTIIGESISLFGKTYTVASGTTFPQAGTPKLVLYGSAETKVLKATEATTVKVSGTTYDVTLDGVASDHSIVVTVNGDTKSIDTSVSRTKTVGGLQVYVDDVYYLSSTTVADNKAKVSFGASTLTLEDGKKAYTAVGGTSTPIQGTLCDLSTSDGKLTMIEVYVAGNSNNVDIVKEGSSFKDPIFGTFSLDFASATPGLMDATKGTLDIKASGDSQLTATFMDYKGNTKTITWANEPTSGTFNLEDGSQYPYVVVEGQPIYQNNNFIVDAGGYSHIFQLSNVNIDGSATGSVDFTDVMSGTVYNVLLGSDNITQKVIDGQNYYVNGSVASDHITVTWGTNAGYTTVGSENTVWPVMPGTKGEVYAFAKNPTAVNISNSQVLVLPTGTALLTVYNGNGSSTTTYLNISDVPGSGYTTTTTCSAINITGGNGCYLKVGKTSTGGAYYNITGAGAGAINIKPAGSTATAYAEDAMVLVEEADSLGNAYSVWVTVANETSGSVVQIMAGSPDFTFTGKNSSALKSDSYKTQYVDLYGAFAEKDTRSQDSVKIWYPDEQMTMNFFVLGPDGAVSTQASAIGGTVNKQTSVKTAVAKLDKDVSEADKNNDNIILVGGPAVNTLVAELAAGSTPLTKDRDWYVTEGKGTAIIDLVADAWGTGKAALVVAGHSWDDTKAVTDILLNYDAHASDLTGTRAIFKNGILSTQTA